MRKGANVVVVVVVNVAVVVFAVVVVVIVIVSVSVYFIVNVVVAAVIDVVCFQQKYSFEQNRTFRTKNKTPSHNATC